MKRVYFIGIGGIGMSALARFYRHAGYSVSGYDRTPSPLTRQLEKEGIDIHYEARTDLIPEEKENTLVIYTPAIPSDMAELAYVRERGYKVIKRSMALGEITSGKRCLAVAGTHGKTTTTTLLAHILRHSGKDCSAFLGGISKNYGSNLILGKGDTAVVEADEFVRSFLCLAPETAVSTSMDAQDKGCRIYVFPVFRRRFPCRRPHIRRQRAYKFRHIVSGGKYRRLHARGPGQGKYRKCSCRLRGRISLRLSSG